VAWWLGVNLFFLACRLPMFALLPGPLAALAVGAVLFLAPAVGWRARFGAGSRLPGAGIIRDVTISAVALLAILGVHRFVGAVPTQRSMWNASWLVANATFVAGAFWRGSVANRRALAPAECVLGFALFAASFGFYYFGATYVVPPQVDHDLEVQGTGYGLATRFEPFLLTDRHTIYYFAHPPLLHFYVAGSFLYFGTFPDLEYYDAASRRALDATEGRPGPLPSGLVPGERGGKLQYRAVGVEGGDYLLAPDADGIQRRVSAATVELSLITRRYNELPHAIETRAPNLFLAAATVALLGIWGTRISRKLWIGLLLALAYGTSPEIFVRSSYGGYFAIGTIASLLMLMAVARRPRSLSVAVVMPAILAAALAALSDHKMAVLPVAAGLVAVAARFVGAPQGHRSVLLGALVTGFGLGTALFWGFGLATDPAVFLEDHLYTHLLNRVTHDNPLGYGGYPTIAGLWLEFLRHSGYVLVPVALLAIAYDLFRSPTAHKGRRTPDRGLWLCWIGLVAVVFSVIDWRMTKHLVPIVLPLFLVLVPERHATSWRVAGVAVIFIGLIAWNTWAVSDLVVNFGSLRPSPDW
jgi:hypothetical protein